MQIQQLLSKKNLFFALFAVAVFVIYGAFEFGFINAVIPQEQNVKTINKSKDSKGVVAILDGNIIINQPLSNDVVSSPLKVSGRARVFEASVSYRLKDANDILLKEGFTTASEGAPGWGLYEINIEFDTPSTPTGWLELYTQSAKDGSDQDLIRMPLTFAEHETPRVEVYFSNITKDPELLNCEVVYPVEREVSSSKELIIGSINHLLAGVTDEEIVQGFVNNLPEEEIKIQGMKLGEGVMTIDFSEALNKGVAGACRVTAIRAQITETLKQFEGIDEVVISIDGETDTVLQP